MRVSVTNVRMLFMPRSLAGDPTEPPRPLRPKDLFDERTGGVVVIVSLRVTFVDERLTKSGHSWAVLIGQWRRHSLRCIVFPTLWAALEHPSLGDAVVIRGEISFREGQAVIWVHDMTEMSPVQSFRRSGVGRWRND